MIGVSVSARAEASLVGRWRSSVVVYGMIAIMLSACTADTPAPPPLPVSAATGSGAVSTPTPSESQTSPAGEPSPKDCHPDAARFAVGKVATPQLLESIKRESNVQMIRVVPEGAGTTRDYVSGRMNIHLDSAGRIVTIRCG